MSPRRRATTDEVTDVAQTLASEAEQESRTAQAAKAKAKALARAALDRVEDEEPTPEPLPELEDAPIITPEPSKMERILGTIQNEGKFEVFRQIGGNSSKVGIFPINEWPDRMETIAAQYGGGTFKVIFKDSRGVIRGQDTQTFDPEAYASRSKAAPAPAASEGTMMDRFLERLDAQNERHAREMSEMRLEMMRQQTELLKTLAGRPAEPAINLLETVKLVKDLMPPPVDPMESLTRTFEVMATLKEKAEDTEPKSPLVVLAEEGMKMLSPLLAVVAQKVAAPAAPAKVRLEQRVPAPSASAPTPSQPPLGGAALPPPAAQPSLPQPPEVAVPEAVRAYAPRLLMAAQSQAKVEAIGNFIVDSIPLDDQAVVDEFDAMLANPQIVDLFIVAEPGLARYRAWVESLLKHMTDLWDAMDEEPVSEEPVPEAAAPAEVPAAPAPAQSSLIVTPAAPAPAPEAAKEPAANA